jgi:hypothetical protein
MLKNDLDFPYTSYTKQDGTRATGTICKTCKNKAREERRKRNGIPESRREAQKRKCSNYYHNNEESREASYLRSREHSLKHQYGITQEDYQRMLNEQDHKCKICSKPAEECTRGILDVDHCHYTGEVRGLLCTDCNNLLGRAKDNIGTLRSAIEYLEDFITRAIDKD